NERTLSCLTGSAHWICIKAVELKFQLKLLRLCKHLKAEVKMTEKLAEISDVLAGIRDAVQTLRSIGGKSDELLKVTELTKAQASEVEQLKLAKEPHREELQPQLDGLSLFLKKLKQELKRVQVTGSHLEVWINSFGRQIDEFETFWKVRIQANIEPDLLKQLCEKLDQLHTMACDFSESLATFTGQLSKSQELTKTLSDGLSQRQAGSSRQAGQAQLLGLIACATVGALGLAALHFFDGGAAFIASFAAGILLGSAAVKTATDLKERRERARCAGACRRKLDSVHRMLWIGCDTARTIQVDEAAIKALRTALQFFTRDVERDDRIAQLETEGLEKDDRIAQLETEGLEKDDRIAQLETEGLEKDDRIAQLETEGLEKDDRIAQLETEGLEKDDRIAQLETEGVEKDDRIAQLEKENAELKIMINRSSEKTSRNELEFDNQFLGECYAMVRSLVTRLNKALRVAVFANANDKFTFSS
ncbi:hypothetical protein BOX15_Mlig020299g1, partial [Macrostomum lignano]